MHVKTLSLLLAAATCASAPASLATDLETGRVSSLEGVLEGWGPFDDERAELVLNSVLSGGDELQTGDTTFAELEMPGETFVRLGPSTDVVIDALDDERLQVSLVDGSVLVSRARKSPDALIATRAGDLVIGERSLVRADADESSVVLRVLEGSAELRGEGTRRLEAGQSLSWPDMRISGSGTFEDAFERWGRERESLVRGRAAPSHVDRRMVGLYELGGHGRWHSVDGHWAWSPYGVATTWRPYGQGHWAWRHPYGWTWIDYHPWGHVTGHYGRWSHHRIHGWCWYPDRGYSRGWVVWAVFGGHVGWAPCDLRGRPIRPHGSHSHYDSRSWSSCESDYFRRGGGHDRCRDCRPERNHGGGHDRHHDHDRDWDRGGGGSRPEREAPFARNREPRFEIRPLDRDLLVTTTPVPVHDPVADLRPRRDIGAERGRSPRVGSPAPAPAPAETLLDRSVRDPSSVRAKPWLRPQPARPASPEGAAPRMPSRVDRVEPGEIQRRGASRPALQPSPPAENPGTEAPTPRSPREMPGDTQAPGSRRESGDVLRRDFPRPATTPAPEAAPTSPRPRTRGMLPPAEPRRPAPAAEPAPPPAPTPAPTPRRDEAQPRFAPEPRAGAPRPAASPNPLFAPRRPADPASRLRAPDSDATRGSRTWPAPSQPSRVAPSPSPAPRAAPAPTPRAAPDPRAAPAPRPAPAPRAAPAPAPAPRAVPAPAPAPRAIPAPRPSQPEAVPAPAPRQPRSRERSDSRSGS